MNTSASYFLTLTTFLILLNWNDFAIATASAGDGVNLKNEKGPAEVMEDRERRAVDSLEQTQKNLMDELSQERALLEELLYETVQMEERVQHLKQTQGLEKRGVKNPFIRFGKRGVKNPFIRFG